MRWSREWSLRWPRPRCAAGWPTTRSGRGATGRGSSWIFPRDPDFAGKAGRVLDLYERVWDGADLGADDYVISADEKSQLQALSRCHPELPPAPGRDRRVEFEYDRHGTLAYLAGYDVHRAHLMGTVAPTIGIVRFSEWWTR